MTVEQAGATQQLSAFALSHAPLSARARHATRRLILDALALGIAGSRQPAAEYAYAATARYAPRPQATLLGRAERSSPQWAALVNGIAASAASVGDVHPGTAISSGAMIVPAAFAAAEFVQSTGEELLQAVARGVEITLRLGLGVMPAIRERGWDGAAAAGHIGAAGAVARILRLDLRQTCSALAIGATQASGFQASAGFMTADFDFGKAAADGVEAAFLARADFSGPLDAVEGRRGFAELLAGGLDAVATTRALGVRFELELVELHPLDGSRGTSLDDAQLFEKASAAVRPILGNRTDSFVRELWRIDELPDVRELHRVLQPN